ncbi:MAG: enoyl-CoA hydratase/isomerase family protein [bacterium]
MRDFESIRVGLRPPLAELVLDRPEQRNALTSGMIGEILEALALIEGEEDARVLLIRGEGTSFCAGADLGELKQVQDASFEENMAASRELVRLFRTIYTYPKATVAAVHGYCVAGGCGIATACDVVVADPEARFRYSEAAIGFVAAIVTVMLLRSVGEKHARELLLTARYTPAAEALRIGLINEVSESGQAMGRAREVAREIALNSTTGIALSKEVLAAVPSMGLDEAFDFAANINAAGRLNSDCREGIAAFMEKREPAWRRRVEEQIEERSRRSTTGI